MDKITQATYREVQGIFQKFLAQLIFMGAIPMDKREIASKVLEDKLRWLREGFERVG